MRSALDTPTRQLDIRGRSLAYREVGSGPPLLLCNRFRGVLDTWDPAFIDALGRVFRVITFDYSGLGRSTGDASYRREALARDAKDLLDALGIERCVVGGWSLGGLAAQALAAQHPSRVTHLILIGTSPPGPQPRSPEPLFYERALRPHNDLDDEVVLFFEPASAPSRAAAAASHARIAARTTDLSPPIPEATYLRLLEEGRHPDMFPDDDGRYRAFFAATELPILVLSGDHEIVFPVENWFALNGQRRSTHLVVMPRAGHGPQHQEPQLSAELITSFVRTRPV